MPSKFSLEGFIVEISSGRCLKKPNSITVEAFYPGGLKDLVEVLALKFPPAKATYSKEWSCLTIKMLDRLVGMYASGKITLCADDMEDAKGVLKTLKELIKEAKEDLKIGGPPSVKDIEVWSKLTPLELYKYLPKTNCRKCDESTCIAFAAKVLSGERKLRDCLPLRHSEELVGKLEEFLGKRILNALGWLKDN